MAENTQLMEFGHIKPRWMSEIFDLEIPQQKQYHFQY